MKCTSEILTIKSERSELKSVERFLLDFFYNNQLPEKYYSKVLLCVSEAVVNSIDHGNQNDASKSVSIEIRCMDEYLEFSISDEGDGFDPDKVEDPTREENLKKEKGRGIHIIKALTDEVEFRDSGKGVRFKWYLSE